jgi:hypothetical protein
LIIIEDDNYGYAMSTPKMRQFKQIFVALWVFGNTFFFDGKKVEWAHLFGKILQNKQNNFKKFFKELVSKKVFNQLRFVYCFNGGKWGTNWQYSVGRGIYSLKHPNPKKSQQPHPFLKSFVIPKSYTVLPKIYPTTFYGNDRFSDIWWQNLLFDDFTDQLIVCLQDAFEDQTFDLNTLRNNNGMYTIERIKGFRLHNGLCSFTMNFDAKYDVKEAECHVKIHESHIMKFKYALKFVNTINKKTALLCKGIYFPIKKTNSSNQWIGNKFNSMDYIDNNDSNIGWQHLTNISEPICLIHNCVSLNNIKSTLPEYIQSQNNLIMQKNLIYWNYQIHLQHHLQQERRLNRNENKIQRPCGAVYRCKLHHLIKCNDCQRNRQDIAQNSKFHLEWYCNTVRNPFFWIFDSLNGYCIGAMKTTHTVENAVYNE